MWSGYRKLGSGLVGCFVGGWAEVAEAGMPASGVVPPFDVLEDCLVRHGFHGPRLPVEQFGLDRGEERLRHRVVRALSFAPNRQPYPRLAGQAGVLAGG